MSGVSISTQVLNFVEEILCLPLFFPSLFLENNALDPDPKKTWQP